MEVLLSPRRPYSLRASAFGTAGGTRRWAGEALEVAYLAAGRPARARVWQRADGRLGARIDAPEPEAAHDALRALLAVDVDHGPFLRQARRDPLMRDLALRHAGLRPMRLSTVAHALVRALCGQLVTGRTAMGTERALLRRCAPEAGGLRAPPTAAQVAALAPAQAVACGLAPRRAAALVRCARELPLERLRDLGAEDLARRVCRERWLGPWSLGVISLYGLGRYEHALVGDLGLMRLWAAERGRWPQAGETAELVSGYGEWAGLASVYLLHHPLARRRGPAAPDRWRPSAVTR